MLHRTVRGPFKFMQPGRSSSYIASNLALIDRALDSVALDSGFALLDFPDICNVGDSAIWLGETAYFRRRGQSPGYVCTIANYDPRTLDRHVPEGPILLHGGGNFGDIWPGHQKFRERVLADFPDRRVIQLPQSIHFDADKNIRHAASAIRKHGKLDLFVRDRESLDFARARLGCEATLCPDMAFAIGPVALTGAPYLPLLAMLRQDREAVGPRVDAQLDGIPVEDWISEDPSTVAHARWRGRLEGLRYLDRATIRVRSYESVARQRFERGRTQLERAQRILTDRLHVHIISLLMDKPRIVLDNSYGKIARFRSAFPEPEGLTLTASSINEALVLLQTELAA